MMGRLVHSGLGSSSFVAHVFHYPPPPREQLYNRYCSNKHNTHRVSFIIGPAVTNTYCPGIFVLGEHSIDFLNIFVLGEQSIDFLRNWEIWSSL